MANEKSAIEKINPKGIIADAIYVSFSGVIESAEVLAFTWSFFWGRMKIFKLAIISSMGNNGTMKHPMFE